MSVAADSDKRPRPFGSLSPLSLKTGRAKKQRGRNAKDQVYRQNFREFLRHPASPIPSLAIWLRRERERGSGSGWSRLLPLYASPLGFATFRLARDKDEGFSPFHFPPPASDLHIDPPPPTIPDRELHLENLKARSRSIFGGNLSMRAAKHL